MGVITLGQIADIMMGQSPTSREINMSHEGTPFYQGNKEFTQHWIGPPATWTTSRLVPRTKPNDILLSVRGTVGVVNQTKEMVAVGRGLAIIRVKQEMVHRVDQNYLFHVLLHFQHKEVIKRLACGTTVEGVCKRSIMDLPVFSTPD
jgi:type I restriction enzyme S subunit